MTDLLNVHLLEIERRQREQRMREENVNTIIKQIADEFRRERKTRKQNK